VKPSRSASSSVGYVAGIKKDCRSRTCSGSGHGAHPLGRREQLRGKGVGLNLARVRRAVALLLIVLAVVVALA
jgi:hypothetical protein